MEKLKVKLLKFRLKIFDFICKVLGMPNYHNALTEAAQEIVRLSSELRRLDQKNALDVRSSLELVNFDSLGPIVWVKSSDERMLRQDSFSQIRDYMRMKHIDPPMFILTGTNVELSSLTDEMLRYAGLQRVPSEST